MLSSELLDIIALQLNSVQWSWLAGLAFIVIFKDSWLLNTSGVLARNYSYYDYF